MKKNREKAVGFDGLDQRIPMVILLLVLLATLFHEFLLEIPCAPAHTHTYIFEEE